MLVGISPLIGPDLLSTLYRMGHGDEIVFADSFFPADTYGRRVVRKDGIRIPELLDAVLPLFALDSYVETPVTMMAPEPGDQLDPDVEVAYRTVVDRYAPQTAPFARIDRFQFYERARNAFAVVVTGETVKYGNVILTKGVTLPSTTLEKGDDPMA